MNQCQLSLCAGLMVTLHALKSDNPSSNPYEVNLICIWKNEIERKRGRD